MLIEIMCSEFKDHGTPRGRIKFRQGLNTVLGSETGTNSIGKSTFLMILDFVFGGDDYANKLDDVQHEVGPHTINFAFEFNGQKYYFSRHTVDYKTVVKCDSKYNPLPNGEIELKEYLLFLQTNYGLNYPGLTFRNAVSRFIRAYKRENLSEEFPLQQYKGEPQKESVTGLLKLTNLYAQIEGQMEITKEAESKLAAFRSARKYALIPFVTKISEFKANEKRIVELREQATALAQRSSAGLLDLDSMQAEQLSLLKSQLSVFKRQRTKIMSQLKSIRADKELGKKSFKKDYSDLLEFFPNIDLKQIEAIDAFHKQLAGILKSEFVETEEALQGSLALVENEIRQIELAIAQSGTETDLTQAVLDQYAAIDKELKNLEAANANYEEAARLTENAKAYRETLDRLVRDTLAQVQMTINTRMSEINTAICGANKTAPFIHIPDAKHYSFYTPKDGGTGSQFKGLVVFDMTMLELTNIPAIVHDSVILKHIEDEAIEKILILYAKSQKQVFIAMDKKGSYTDESKRIMEETKILQVSAGEGALFGRAWNKRDEEQDVQ